MKRLILFAVLAMPIFVQAIAAQPDRGFGNRSNEKRLALVVGNSDYQNTTPLPNPKNDAADMKTALESLGFEVFYGVNQNARQMKALIRQFGDKLLQTKGVGLFYYAGHGVASGGENYLVPVDADIPSEDEIADATVSLSFLLGKMAVAENSLNLVILDACRNNPFARKWRTVRDTSTNGGLATIRQAPIGTLIAYATQPGNTASDGTGRNGLYTESLLQQMKKPNIAIEEVFKNVRSQVRQKSKNAQIPWESSSIEGEFYFATASNPNPKLTPPRTETAINETKPEDVEREAWLDIQNSTNSNTFREFLKEYPNGANSNKAKIRLEQLVWENVKDSQDKNKLQSYLTEFPNGVNASRARLKLSDLNTVASKPPDTTPTTESNANETTNSIGMKFVKIPGKNFSMGKYEVTQAEWQAVMGSLPTNCNFGGLSGSFLGDRKPIVCVSWNDVQEYLKKLNTKGVGKYRLPTDVEWEYAVRAGTTTEYYWGDDISQAIYYGWYEENSENTIHEVGLKRPNQFGLYDMSGNVWEWCEDKRSELTRVIRGGGWGRLGKIGGVGIISSSKNDGYSPPIRNSQVGFRLVLEN